MPPGLITTYLFRGTWLWLIVRLVAMALAPIARDRDGTGGDVGHVAPFMITAALAAVDLWRRRERVLLANIGLPGGVPVTLMLLPAAIGELMLSLSTDAD